MLLRYVISIRLIVFHSTKMDFIFCSLNAAAVDVVVVGQIKLQLFQVPRRKHFVDAQFEHANEHLQRRAAASIICACTLYIQ